jgi:hypothetical protein
MGTSYQILSQPSSDLNKVRVLIKDKQSNKISKDEQIWTEFCLLCLSWMMAVRMKHCFNYLTDINL